MPALDAHPIREIDLGKRLFHDKRLSADGRIACATCHQSGQAFADQTSVSVGHDGRAGLRNAPSLVNVRFQQSLFWDGRQTSLEDMVLEPLVSPIEHGLGDPEAVSARLASLPEYQGDFPRAAAGTVAHLRELVRALAAYLRTLVAGDSAFDRYQYAGEASALSAGALRGLALFTGRAEYATCHRIEARHALFTDHDFHSAGVGLAAVQERLPALAKVGFEIAPKDIGAALVARPGLSELGRFLVTKEPHDIGKFKTPSLRNVSRTAPYMHDGSVPTLEAALEQELYYRGLSQGKPIVLTLEERGDILEFLRALNSRDP